MPKRYSKNSVMHEVQVLANRMNRAIANFNNPDTSDIDPRQLALAQKAVDARDERLKGKIMCRCFLYHSPEDVSPGYTQAGKPCWFCDECIPF